MVIPLPENPFNGFNILMIVSFILGIGSFCVIYDDDIINSDFSNFLFNKILLDTSDLLFPYNKLIQLDPLVLNRLL